jgi:peptide/nickel transport system permease protein
MNDQNPLKAKLALVNAKVALQKKNRMEARRWALIAARLAPSIEEPWLILAAVSSPSASVSHLQRALSINPNSERALKGMQWALSRLDMENKGVGPVEDRPDLADTQPIKVKINSSTAQVRLKSQISGEGNVETNSSIAILKPIQKMTTDNISKHESIYHSAWVILRSRPAVLFSLAVILIFIMITIFANLIAPFPVDEIHLGFSDLPPAWVKESRLHLSGNPQFLLGTDTIGRDLLSWGLFGTRTSLLLGLISAPLIAIFGTIYGLISGFSGGKTDNVMMRITDVFYSFPTIMVYIIVVLVLRDTPFGMAYSGLLMFFVAILSVGWVSIARLVRSKVLSIRNLEYIEAAYAIGAKPFHILFKHIFPNVLPTIFVWLTYAVPQIILIESILGYLGIGLTSPDRSAFPDRFAFYGASWGGMFYAGRHILRSQPIMTILPAAGITLISLAFTFLGDSLRDAFDPRYQAKSSVRAIKAD